MMVVVETTSVTSWWLIGESSGSPVVRRAARPRQQPHRRAAVGTAREDAESTFAVLTKVRPSRKKSDDVDRTRSAPAPSSPRWRESSGASPEARLR
ncbi:hypothetical protein [Actinomyces viscosus]|uniref:hypothetical protein n=1 Tax=Actinomyces viscosus TaxID=1656 RepID=UPI0028E746CD|nr:hypothetical protein [Actinomyces viscosus]